jgi:hypothetical protein
MAIFQKDAPSMEEHDFTHQTQAESGTFFPGVGAIKGVETFEDPREGVIGNSWPLVFHR